MRTDSKPAPGVIDLVGETARLHALEALKILDTPPEEAFDDLVWLASALCNAPIALVSLVDGHRQWFKARHGVDAQETPRSDSFCAHAIGSDELLEVEDACDDPRFAANPLVLGAPHIRFYCGAPLVGAKGHRFGTLCVVDAEPRRLTAEQREALTRLARRASEALESRRDRFVAQAREQAIAQLLEALPDAVLTCDASGMLKEFNAAARAWHGVDVRELPPEDWAQHFDLYQASGEQLLNRDEVPLFRAWNGERVQGARIQIHAKGQPPRMMSCNADPLLGADGSVLGAVCVMHDVTAVAVAQDESRLQAQRFAGAFAAAAQGMALVSTNGQWLEVNDAVCEMFGYDRESLLQIDFQRVTHPEDLSTDLELVADVLAGRRASYQLDKRYFHRSGRTIHAHLSVSLVRDAKGMPLHFVSQIQDLTLRHQAEQRLRDSEQRMRSVLENSYDAFIAIDDSEAIVEWNRAAEATFGWRRSEVLGRSLADVIVPPGTRAAHRAGMQRYLRTGEGRSLDQRLQLPALHRSGHEFPVEMTISAVMVGNRRLFNAFLHDISARRAAELRLTTSEERLRTVADNVPALIGHVGADLRYQFVNRPYAEWFGKTPEEIVGRHMNEVLRAEDFNALSDKLALVLAGQTISFDMDVPDKDGQTRHMHATYIPDSRKQERVEHGGFHLMMHDVTAQTRLARVLEERALTDELTGLPNRAAWTAELQRWVARAQRVGARMAVMFLDLNGFKEINDRHGHAAGDAVLREFAHRLRSALRRGDFIARLAGDEFVVLLDRMSDVQRDFSHIAEKIRHALAPPVDVNGALLHITASMGFATQEGPDFDVERLMRLADEAMYDAKRSEDKTYAVRC